MVAFPMKHFIQFVVFILVFNARQLQAQHFPYEINSACDLPPLHLTFELFVDNVATNTYLLGWKQTPGMQNNADYKTNEQELQNCGLSILITDSQHNLGAINSQNLSQRFFQFIPNEETITLYVKLGSSYSYESCDCRYQKIQLRVNQHSITEVMLQPDTTIHYLQYMTAGLHSIMISDPMPGGYAMTEIITNMYYLNIKTGRIRAGWHLLTNYTVAYLCTHSSNYIIIDPFEFYSDRKNQSFSGNDLIHMKRLSETEFDLNNFTNYHSSFWGN